MTDIVTTQVFTWIKVEGRKDPIMLPRLPIARVLPRIGMELAKPDIRVRGKVTIEMSVLELTLNGDDTLGGLDLSGVTIYQMTDEEEAEALTHPMQTDIFFRAYHEMTASDTNLNATPPDQQQFLRSHMEKYRNTPYWDGVHRR